MNRLRFYVYRFQLWLKRKSQAEAKAARNADHIWHVWINKRQDERRKGGLGWEHSLYEFKSLLQFLTYGHKQIEDAFTGNLPKAHKQCSHSPVVPVLDNKLYCCLGKEVTTCPILISLKDAVTAERDRVAPYDGSRPYADVDDQQLYRLMAKTCAWHIYHDACSIPDGHHFTCDTSEGYLIDKTDRMFWDRVYESMSASDPDTDEAEPC